MKLAPRVLISKSHGGENFHCELFFTNAFMRNCWPKKHLLYVSDIFFSLDYKISKLSQSMWHDQYVATSTFAEYTTTIKKNNIVSLCVVINNKKLVSNICHDKKFSN